MRREKEVEEGKREGKRGRREKGGKKGSGVFSWEMKGGNEKGNEKGSGVLFGNDSRPFFFSLDLILNFALDVAATTSDTANGANESYWGEYRVNWTFNGSGTVGAVVDQNTAFVWTPDQNAGITPAPGVASWTRLGLTPEDNSGPAANQEVKRQIFVPAQ